MKLKLFRTQNGLSQQQLANKLGVSRSTVAMWETEKSQPDNSLLLKCAQILNVSVDALLDNTAALSFSHGGVKIPVLGRVQAGIPIEAIDDILDYEEITEDMARQGEFFALKVRGNSMEPKFSDGDVVIVKQQPDVESGDIAIVLVNGSSATIKKVKKTGNGIMLIPSNDAYEVMFYTNKDIIEKPVCILGKVVELRAKF